MERYVYSLFPHLSPVISVPATEYFLGDNSALNTLNQSKTMDTWKIWNELGDLRCHGRVLFHEAELFRTGRRERLRETGGRTCQHTHTHTRTHAHTHTHTHGRLSQCRWLLRHYTHIFRQSLTGGLLQLVLLSLKDLN